MGLLQQVIRGCRPAPRRVMVYGVQGVGKSTFGAAAPRPIFIQTEALRLYPAMEQAVGDAGQNIPVVLHRANQHPWVAIVRLDDLPQLAVQLYLTLAQNR